MVAVSNASGTIEPACDTVVVPKSASRRHLDNVLEKALFAETYCLTEAAAPEGYQLLAAATFGELPPPDEQPPSDGGGVIGF